MASPKVATYDLQPEMSAYEVCDKCVERIKSGNLLEVARVIKTLMRRDKQRGLSNGERKMLHSAKQILLSEVVLVEQAPYQEAEKRIDRAMLSEE